MFMVIVLVLFVLFFLNFWIVMLMSVLRRVLIVVINCVFMVCFFVNLDWISRVKLLILWGILWKKIVIVVVVLMVGEV